MLTSASKKLKRKNKTPKPLRAKKRPSLWRRFYQTMKHAPKQKRAQWRPVSQSQRSQNELKLLVLRRRYYKLWRNLGQPCIAAAERQPLRDRHIKKLRKRFPRKAIRMAKRRLRGKKGAKRRNARVLRLLVNPRTAEIYRQAGTLWKKRKTPARAKKKSARTKRHSKLKPKSARRKLRKVAGPSTRKARPLSSTKATRRVRNKRRVKKRPKATRKKLHRADAAAVRYVHRLVSNGAKTRATLMVERASAFFQWYRATVCFPQTRALRIEYRQRLRQWITHYTRYKHTRKFYNEQHVYPALAHIRRVRSQEELRVRVIQAKLLKLATRRAPKSKRRKFEKLIKAQLRYLFECFFARAVYVQERRVIPKLPTRRPAKPALVVQEVVRRNWNAALTTWPKNKILPRKRNQRRLTRELLHVYRRPTRGVYLARVSKRLYRKGRLRLRRRNKWWKRKYRESKKPWYEMSDKSFWRVVNALNNADLTRVIAQKAPRARVIYSQQDLSSSNKDLKLVSKRSRPRIILPSGSLKYKPAKDSRLKPEFKANPYLDRDRRRINKNRRRRNPRVRSLRHEKRRARRLSKREVYNRAARPADQGKRNQTNNHQTEKPTFAYRTILSVVTPKKEKHESAGRTVDSRNGRRTPLQPPGTTRRPPGLQRRPFSTSTRDRIDRFQLKMSHFPFNFTLVWGPRLSLVYHAVLLLLMLFSLISPVFTELWVLCANDGAETFAREAATVWPPAIKQPLPDVWVPATVRDVIVLNGGKIVCPETYRGPAVVSFYYPSTPYTLWPTEYKLECSHFADIWAFITGKRVETSPSTMPVEKTDTIELPSASETTKVPKKS